MKLSAFLILLTLATPAFASDDASVDQDALEKARRMQQREQLKNNFNKAHPNTGKTINVPKTMQQQQRDALQEQIQKRRQDMLGQQPQ